MGNLCRRTLTTSTILFVRQRRCIIAGVSRPPALPPSARTRHCSAASSATPTSDQLLVEENLWHRSAPRPLSQHTFSLSVNTSMLISTNLSPFTLKNLRTVVQSLQLDLKKKPIRPFIACSSSATTLTLGSR
ncbi:putative sphingomyelin phosphodiesterase 4 isoform X1 [Sesbania bispinosa]|nr:putative sphingomyelin phosphodiesterase 4 isoform X1 [Sesbania bispinosa]